MLLFVRTPTYIKSLDMKMLANFHSVGSLPYLQ